MSAPEQFTVALSLQEGYRFDLDFDPGSSAGLGVHTLVMDEPEPLGQGAGPNASRLLAAAVGNCLAASALYCLRRARIDVQGMSGVVKGTLARNQAGRLRVTSLAVELQPVVPAAQRERMGRCLEIFEDFCVVTQSVRQGLDVAVSVQPQDPPLS